MSRKRKNTLCYYFEEHPEHPDTFAHRSDYVEVRVEDDRTGMSVETFTRALLDNLYYIQGVDRSNATMHDWYMALSFTVRDRLMQRWIKTQQATVSSKAKSVFYLSAEFLLGRQLGNCLLNVCCFRQAKEALRAYGLDLYAVMEQEAEPGLGNGGLGRLAACFLDSLATLDIPAIGYGIRYEFGIFEQAIQDGWQIEKPDKWLRWENPWEISRPHQSIEVKFGGHVEFHKDASGIHRARWIPSRTVIGTPYDMLVPGFATNMVNTLRLWSAGTSKDFDFQIFDSGDYFSAVSEKTFSENISKVLYPNDNLPQGRELRLRQQYFFVACSLHDILRRHLAHYESLDNLHEKAAVQLNDTHPAIAVAELMRLLIDEHLLEWDKAWSITVQTLGYTNHTLLSEALERWPISLFESLLPRHLQLIFEINTKFLNEVRGRFPGDEARCMRMSLVEEGTEKKIRMANLATVGSHKVNGVAALHSSLVKQSLLRDFYEMWPEKFTNKTNGITPRRWLMLSNPKLTYLISDRIGKKWINDLDELKKLESLVEDSAFRETWRIFKDENKSDLAEYIQQFNGIRVNTNSIFDIQVKRLHEYKRQLLNALHIITLYRRIKANPSIDMVPRTFIFGAKAAPGYFMAKLIIKLINSIAEVVNNDPDVGNRLKVVFLANFCVSLGERVYPAADLSEQISLAGKEASGTGNMKFSLNGALTIGTLDGANVEIRDAVGPENFFLFGHTVDEVNRIKSQGYNPRDYYNKDDELREVLDRISSGWFSRGDKELFRPIVDSLLTRDEYLLLADYRSYVECQNTVSNEFRNQEEWTKKCILNVARIGFFSSDRTIKEYCEEIWNTHPIQVSLDDSEYNRIKNDKATYDIPQQDQLHDTDSSVEELTTTTVKIRRNSRAKKQQQE